MGVRLQSGMGDYTTVSSFAGKGAAVAAPYLALIPVVGPFIALGAALLGPIMGFFKPDVAKLQDTAYLEAAQVAFNVMWFQLTGEALDGITHIAPPGQYGAMHYQLFGVTQYPNVPAGPLGDASVDTAVLRASAAQTYEQTAAAFVRPQSLDNLNDKYQKFLAQLDLVDQARASAPITDQFSQALAGLGLPAWAPVALGGVVLYLVAS